MFKKISCAAIAAALLLSVVGCGANTGTTSSNAASSASQATSDAGSTAASSQPTASAAKTIQVTDSTGKSIEIAQPLQRVVTFNSGLYDCMRALGVDATLVGRGSSLVIDGKDIPDVGAWDAPNIEVILEIAPEAVFAYAGKITPEDEKILENSGIHCIYLEMTKADRIVEEYQTLAKLFGKEEKAKTYLDLNQKYTDLLEERLSDLKEGERRTIYYEGYSDYKSVNKTAGGQTLIDMAGGINIAAEEEAAYPEISDEWLLENNPNMILKLISSTNKEVFGETVTDAQKAQKEYEKLLSRPGWKDMQAVKDGNVLLLSGTISTNALGSIVGSVYMAKALYPERFQDLDPQKVHEEIYTALYGEPLTGLWAYQPTV